MIFKADLHLHTCLSPCGDLEMSPDAVVLEAKKKGLDILAVTDHNTALNTPAFAEACLRHGLAALFGIEATTAEELHLLCLFSSPEEAVTFGERSYRELVTYPNDPLKFGDQVVVDSENNIIQELDKCLIGGALPHGVDELTSIVHEKGGIAIPAHIDRHSYSIMSQLGFLPAAPFDGVEMTLSSSNIDTRNYGVTASSDAHMLKDIGRRHTLFDIEESTFEMIREALLAGKSIPVFSEPEG